jgi:hypothetical protein
VKRFIKEYRVEIIAVLIALLGVFLLVERIEIRATIIQTSGWIYETAKQLAQTSWENLTIYITSFTVSDIIGWILIAVTSVFVAWRLRYRFLKSRFWRIKDCPRCGSSLHRIHRTPFQRFLTLFLLPNGRSYRCTNDNCRWSGLRWRVHYKRRPKAEIPVELEESNDV